MLGFNRKSEIFLAEEFRALGAEVVIATADGSVGLKGLVTDGMAPCPTIPISTPAARSRCSRRCTLIARPPASSALRSDGCGFALHGLLLRDKYGNKLICKDGPVLEKEEIVW